MHRQRVWVRLWDRPLLFYERYQREERVDLVDGVDSAEVGEGGEVILVVEEEEGILVAEGGEDREGQQLGIMVDDMWVFAICYCN